MEKIKKIILILVILIMSVSVVSKSFQNDTFFTIAIGNSILENGNTNMETLTWHENLEFPHSRSV